MQDRFEKEVQQKMEEMKMAPSTPVWERIQVEVKVKDKKRKRRVIFWFLLAGLFLAGGGFWAYQSLIKEVPQISSADTNTTSQHSNTIKPTIPQEPISNTTESSDKTNRIKTSDNKENNFENSVVSNPERPQLSTSQKVKTPQSSATDKKSSEENSIVLKPAISKEEKEQQEIPVETKPFDETSSLKIQKNSKDIITQQPIPVIDDSTLKPAIQKELIPEIVIKDSSAKKKIAANKKWNRQINVSAGWNNYSTGLLQKSASRDAFASIGGGTGSGLVNNNFTPAPTSGGFGFALGYSLSKNLGRHWEFSFGLQYAQLTTRTKVGDKKQADTTVNFAMDRVQVNEFFTNTAKNNYTARFHILELPVSVSYRPSLKLPLYISAGAAYGLLFSTNALTFSSSSNIYYKNKENYVRNLLPVNASLQYRFGDKKKIQVQAGPMIQYNLLKLQKEGSGAKSHLLFTGLKTTINF